MIYLRALGFFLSDRLRCWTEGDNEPMTYRGALGLLRALDAVQ